MKIFDKYILNQVLNFCVFQKMFKRKYWLLMDNIFNDDAELIDNFSLFEYMQTKKEFKDITYYVINKNNINYTTVKSKYKDKIIPVKNCKININLILKLFNAKYWLDSFQVLNNFNLKLRTKLVKSPIETIYTQHGINFFKRWFLDIPDIGDNYFNKIIFSNETERNWFKQFYGYDDKNTVLAGLSCWDNMVNTKRDRVIFMYFTFRSYLRHPKINMSQTNYYKNITELLNSKRLSGILEKYDTKICLGLHHTLSSDIKIDTQYIKSIDDSEISRIKQIASMLITDYSSMCFDFMYRDLPVCFYRLDKDTELLAIDPEGRVNYENVENKNEDLYNIFYDKDSVIDCIERYCKNNFESEEEFKQKNNKFFTYRNNIKDHIIEGIINSPENVPNHCDKIPSGVLEPNREYFFRDDIPVAVDGMWFIENFGKYGVGNKSVLWLKMSESVNTVQIVLNPILYKKKVKSREIKIFLNDKLYKGITFEESQDYPIDITISEEDKKNDIQKIVFDFGKVSSPKRLKISRDPRKLSAKFISIKTFWHK